MDYTDTEIDKINKKYPNRIPVILQQTDRFKRLHKLQKTKYLIHSENNVGFFLFQLKKINNIHSTDAIYLLHENTLVRSCDTFGSLQIRYRTTKVLILTVDTESSFG